MKDAVYIEKAINSHILVNQVQLVERVKYVYHLLICTCVTAPMNGQPDKIIFKFILHWNCFPALKQYDLPHAFNLQACKCPTGHFFRGNSVL